METLEVGNLYQINPVLNEFIRETQNMIMCHNFNYLSANTIEKRIQDTIYVYITLIPNSCCGQGNIDLLGIYQKEKLVKAYGISGTLVTEIPIIEFENQEKRLEQLSNLEGYIREDDFNKINSILTAYERQVYSNITMQKLILLSYLVNQEKRALSPFENYCFQVSASRNEYIDHLKLLAKTRQYHR